MRAVKKDLAASELSGLLRCGLLWIVLCGVVGGATAQQTEGTDRAARSERAFEKMRERLRTRPAEERARLERHLEEFEGLPAPTRAKLLERARALRERERAVDSAAPRELRRQLEELEGDQARELWVSHLRERFRERGHELRARLPENLRRRLERAPPEARRSFLERLFRERESVSRKALARMRELYGLPRGEIQRLERLPLPERLHAMVEMHSRAVSASGAELEGG